MQHHIWLSKISLPVLDTFESSSVSILSLCLLKIPDCLAVDLKKVLRATKHGFIFWAQHKANATLEIYKGFQEHLTFPGAVGFRHVSASETNNVSTAFLLPHFRSFLFPLRFWSRIFSFPFDCEINVSEIFPLRTIKVTFTLTCAPKSWRRF